MLRINQDGYHTMVPDPEEPSLAGLRDINDLPPADGHFGRGKPVLNNVTG